MAVSFVDIASSGSDALSSSRSVTKPVGVSAGDVALFHLHRWNSSSSFANVTTVPSGAVQVGSTVGASGFIESRIYAMYVGAETSYTFDWGSDYWTVLHAQFWTGVASGLDLTTLPIDIGAGSSSTTLPSRTVTTTTGAGLAWFCNSHNYSGGETHTPPTGYSEVLDIQEGSAGWKIATGVSETASSGTISSAQITITALIALPSDGGDPPPPPANVQRVAVTTGAPSSTSAFTPTLPSNQAGDRMTLVVTGKYNTTTIPTINQGWTLVGSGTGGTGSTGNDAGQTFWAVYQKDSTGSETAPTVTPGGTSPNSWEWVCVSHRLGDNASWADAIVGSAGYIKAASDTSTSSPLTGTASSFANAPKSGDAIFCVGVIPTDLGTALGTTTLTVTGLSAGTKSTATSQYIENALGQDTAAVWADWVDFTGTATAGVAMSFTVTGASNQSGSLIAIALRQTVQQVVSLPVATEADAAQVVHRAGPISVSLPVATEADAAQAITRFIDEPLVTDVSADGRYLIDQHGAPIIPLFDTIWPMVQQAGNTARNGGSATWQQDIDFWVTTRAAQGFNALKCNMFGNTISGAPNNDSRTWDSVWPFGASGSGTSGANPSTGQIEAYWQRVDYLMDACAAAGMTLFIHVFYADDVDSGVMAGKSTSEFQALGTFLGNRYKDKPGIVWVVGGDYFDTARTGIQACRTNMIAAGDSHLWTVQNWADQGANEWTTSRKDNTGATQQLGTAIADINASYIYDPTYLSAAAAWAETPTIPNIWYDGYYDQGTGDQLQQRRYVGWSLTYGQWGCQFGDEGTWAQPNGWRTAVSSPDASVSHITTMRAFIASISGWQTIVPDSSSTFITAGRGSGNTFVTGGRAADGSLAMLYLPNASSAVTVDTTQMVAGYTVTWIDPISGATSAGTPGTSFSKGNNSGGSTDWFLVLQASGDQVVSLPTVTETDAAQALTKKKIKSDPISTETDAAQVLAKRKVKLLPVATETSSPIGLSRSKRRSLSIVTEADASQVLTHRKVKSLQWVAETDASQTLVRQHKRAVSIASEADTPQALSHVKIKLLPISTETDLATSFAHQIVVALPVATESNSSQSIGKSERKALPVVTETDVSQTISRIKRKPIVVITETDAAQLLARVERKALPVSTELDISQLFGRRESKALPIAGETSQALGFSHPGQLFAASEIDLAITILRRKIKTLPVVTEGDSATTLGRVSIRAVPVVIESDNAQQMSHWKVRLLEVASETDIPVSISDGTLPKWTETEVYLNGEWVLATVLGVAVGGSLVDVSIATA